MAGILKISLHMQNFKGVQKIDVKCPTEKRLLELFFLIAIAILYCLTNRFSLFNELLKISRHIFYSGKIETKKSVLYLFLW